MTDMLELNRRFGAPGRIAFRISRHGLPEMVLVNGHGSCEISLYGGQVINYRPMGHAPMLFTSRASAHETGRRIFGGIPLCWPWFGAPPAEDLPRHGFAGLMLWDVLATSYDGTSSEVTLRLTDSNDSLALWPHRFELIQRITLSDNLSIELTTCNHDTVPFHISQSIHPYFKIRDISRACIKGLEETEYTDTLTGSRQRLEEPLRINSETYRIFDTEDQAVAVRDEGLNRDILMTCRGFHKMVVWNPWIEKSAIIADFGNDEYLRMVTVAPAVLPEDAILVPPGDRTTVSAAFQVVLA